MNRRRFIVAGSALVGTATLGFCLSGCGFGGSDAAPTLALIWEPETIKEIGKKYLASSPGEDNLQTLTDFLSPLEDKDVELIVKDDFVAGRTVQIEGWIISLTEARQCALASLSS